MKRAIAILTAVLMLLGCMSMLGLSAAAIEAPDVVREGLVAWYDGTNNSNGSHSTETTLWRDLSGNRNHMYVRLNETNYWTDNALHVDATPTYFPDELIDVMNGDAFTVEFVAGELVYSPELTDRVVFLYSDNTEMSLFIRTEEGLDNLEFKYNDRNRERPRAEDGRSMSNNATIAMTFDYSKRECILYVNGAAVASAVPEYRVNTDSFYFCYDNPQRSWSGDVHGFRFYDRALTEDELQDNAKHDNRRYRSGYDFPPEVQYDDSDENFGGEDGTVYTNDLVPINQKTDLIDRDAWYGNVSLQDYMYPYEGDEEQWEGARIMMTEEPDTQPDSGAERAPSFHINYQKYCRRNGLTQMQGEDVNFIVLKIRAVDFVGDLYMRAMFNEAYSYFEADTYDTYSYFGCVEGTGEVEYLIYDVTDCMYGQINLFMIEPTDMDAESRIYVQEMAFFATADEAFLYAGVEIEEDPTEESDDASTELTTDRVADTIPGDTSPATESTSEADDDGGNGGCGGVLGWGVAFILPIAAFAALRKKE